MLESNRDVGSFRPVSEALGFDPVLMSTETTIYVGRPDSRGVLDTVNVPVSRKLIAEIVILGFLAH
jgi:hypothetical protein